MKDTKIRDITAKAKSDGERNTNKNFLHKRLSILLALLLLAGLFTAQRIADQAFAAENIDVKISQTGGYFAVAGGTGVNVTMKVENNGKEAITFLDKTGLSKTSRVLTGPPCIGKSDGEPRNLRRYF